MGSIRGGAGGGAGDGGERRAGEGPPGTFYATATGSGWIGNERSPQRYLEFYVTDAEAHFLSVRILIV